MNIAKITEKNYINTQNKEIEELEELYSQIKVATGEVAEITISMEDLNKMIENKVKQEIVKLEKKVSDLENNLVVLYNNPAELVNGSSSLLVKYARHKWTNNNIIRFTPKL